MNKIKSYFAAAALLLAGLTSCSSEQMATSTAQQSGKSGSTKVTVKVNTGNTAVKTRAEAGSTGTLAGADRENAITSLYAVVYKDKNSSYAYHGTYVCTAEATAGEYTFDVEEGGVYYMYLVANPTADLITILNNGSNQIDSEADLYASIVAPAHGPTADITTVTNFVMTSPRTQIDVDGTNDTVVNGDGSGIELTRLAARFDIDATALNIANADPKKETSFQITKVTMNTRYTQSDLMRGSSRGLAMTGLTSVSDVEFSGFTTLADYIPADNSYWKGAIYSCENYDTANPTVLTIEGVYKHGENAALNVTQDVVFRDIVRDGSGNITSNDVIQILRNHLYKVVLTPKYDNGSLVFDEIDYRIQVADWQTGETVVFAGDANLTAQSTPSFTVTGALSVSGTEADGVTNPTLIYTGVDDHSVYLKVTSNTTGTMLECPTFDSTKYGLVASETTNDADGNLVETYKIDIDDDVAIATDYTFILSNAINTGLARTFILRKRGRLPLEYMAKGSVRSLYQTDGHWVIDNEVHVYSSAFFNWDTASTCFGIDNGDGFNTFNALCSYTDPVTGETTTGYYHMPTINEWYGILPSDGVQVFRVSQNTNTTLSNEKKTVIGPIVLEGYTSQFYRTWSTDYNDVTYALRFMNDPVYGNLYRCAYRYQYFDDASSTPSRKWQRYVISCIYVGDDPDITSVDDVKASFWADTSGKEVITRTLPCTSNSGAGQCDTGAASGSGYYPGYNTCYRSSTNATSGIMCPIGPTLNITTNYSHLNSSKGVTVRLFSNN